MPAKPWLRDYFKRLAKSLDNSEIRGEAALKRAVEIPESVWGSNAKTLLQAMEYTKDDVKAEYAIQKGTKGPTVDFLVGERSSRWMLDLKAPNERCDREKYVGQLQSYLVLERVALGVLFNGELALAFANPQHAAISEICRRIPEDDKKEFPILDLARTPVLTAHLDVLCESRDCRDIVRFFSQFRCLNGSMPNIEAIARRLAEDYLRKATRRVKDYRQMSIAKDVVAETLEEPSQRLILAIIEASDSLKEIGAKPDIVRSVWPRIYPPDITRP